MKKSIKIISLFLALCALVFTFTACNNVTPPAKTAFVLENDFSQKTVKVGSRVTYKVNLKNLSDDSYTLVYGEPLIKLEVISVEENSNSEEPLEELAEHKFIETDIAPNGQIEEFIDFKPVKAGDYILKASCKFKIEGKDYDEYYEYECDDLQITVVEG